jgi:hypothetical protein
VAGDLSTMQSLKPGDFEIVRSDKGAVPLLPKTK